MPRYKKETSIDENLSDSELAKGRSESLTISKLKKEVASLNDQTSCLQNHYEELKKNSLVCEFIKICLMIFAMHTILTHFFEMRAMERENHTNNDSRVSVIEQSKHEATSDLSEIISRTKKFYYRNENGDLIKITSGNSDCLVATQVSITSVSAALESCFNNVAP
ncbi:hypothetical protein G7017_03875 [Pseudomonas fulva]|uniref:hypothetical protein n=1 Tax=Pseudomonas TaxID=286 RepID=UPI0015E33A41|nr:MULTISPECIES: hypothetical protein [Pseudomonas]MBA1220042.1 hypothetical protein [Pseudomonas fulva]MDG9889241.1 hypothetical protein [Pseudomonas juntendi]